MYIVTNDNGKYYTHDQRKFEGQQPFLWSSHKLLAKRYTKRGWAKKVAEKVGGAVLAHSSALRSHNNRSRGVTINEVG